MKILTINTPDGSSRYTLDAVRSVHVVPVDVKLSQGEEPQPYHIPDTKWVLVVELRPIKILDPAGSGQVIDHCQQKEWLFDTREDAEKTIVVEDV